jgi:hypothetical protein
MRDKLDPQVRKSIVRLSSPRFFWRARAFDKKAELCELLLDATDMEPSFQLFAMNVFDTALLRGLGKIPSWKRAALERDGRRLGGFLLRFIDEHFGKDSHS